MKRRSTLALWGLLTACTPPPEALQVSITPADPTTTDELVATVGGPTTDDDGDAITYTAIWYVDGSDVDHLEGLTVPASETTKHEQWKLFVLPTDGKLDGPPSEAVVTVSNTPPSVEVSLSPEVPLTTEDVVATVTGTDPDDDGLTYSYAWSIDGVETGYHDATLPASATERGDIWTLSVTPNDSETDGEAALASVSIDNTAPEITSVLIPDTEIREADEIPLVVYTEDADGDRVSLDFAWYADDELVLQGPDGTITGKHFDKHQQITVVITPNDGFVDGEPVTTGPITILNTAPSVTAASVSPTEIYEASELSCVGEGWSDDDDDDEAYQVTWTVAGLEVSTESALTGAHFARGDNITCTLVPDDGEDQGEAVQSEPVTVLNTTPAISAVTLSTTAPAEGDTIEVAVEASDEDDDDISYAYAWFVDGVQVATSDSIDSTLFDKHQSIYVEVTPSDDADTGAMVSSSAATAVNTPPEVVSLSLSPSDLYTDDTLASSVTTTDADGDTVTLSYAWTVDGSAVSETGSSLDGETWFDKHQTVVVVVTPNDGEDDGDTATGSIDVHNSPPGAPEIDIDPEEPIQDVDDFVCAVSTDSTDVDGDTVSYSHSWLVDGVAYTGATSTTTTTDDTIPAGAADAQQVFTCQVTPNDGTDDGTAASAEVTIRSLFEGWDPTTSSASIADYTFIGEAAGDMAADSIAGGGDVDGDGVPDLLIGAYRSDDGGTQNGKTHLVLGSSLGSTTAIDLSGADYEFVGYPDSLGADTYREVGCALSFIYDLDGDGGDEVVFSQGAWGHDIHRSTFVFFSSSLSTTTTLSADDADLLISDSSSSSKSWSGGPVGDLDDDGLEDLLISGWRGEALLFYGSSLASGGILATDSPDVIFNESTESITDGKNLGDLDGDGIGDLALANRDYGSGDEGGVFVFLASSLSGATSISDSDYDWLLVGENSEDRAATITSYGDLDQDGVSDILIGAYGYDGAGSELGRAYLFLGSTLGVDTTPDLADSTHTFTGEVDGDASAYVSDAGDVDGDGIPDFMVGTRESDEAHTSAGKIYLVLGGNLGSGGHHDLADADFAFTGEASSDRLFTRSTAGDINGDGLGDLLLGAYENDDGGSNAGKAYLFLAPAAE